jgi:hypothetical protein
VVKPKLPNPELTTVIFGETRGRYLSTLGEITPEEIESGESKTLES